MERGGILRILAAIIHLYPASSRFFSVVLARKTPFLLLRLSSTGATWLLVQLAGCPEVVQVVIDTFNLAFSAISSVYCYLESARPASGRLMV